MSRKVQRTHANLAGSHGNLIETVYSHETEESGEHPEEVYTKISKMFSNEGDTCLALHGIRGEAPDCMVEKWP